MSLKFKGNKTTSDVLNKTLKLGSKISKPVEKIKLPPGVIKSKVVEDNQPKQIDIDQLGSGDIQEIKKTTAQEQFELIRRKRQLKRIDDKLQLTYKQRIDNYNKSLSALPDHFDIPRVGPG